MQGFFFFFFFLSIHLYFAKGFGLIHWAEKTILNIANFRGNIHNVMCKKQPEVRSRTALLSCILTISTGSISGHDLSIDLCIQAMAFSNISASLSCLLLVCFPCVILYWMQQRQIFLLSSLNPLLFHFLHSALHPTTQKIQFSSFQAFWIQMTHCSLQPAICASH